MAGGKTDEGGQMMHKLLCWLGLHEWRHDADTPPLEEFPMSFEEFMRKVVVYCKYCKRLR